MARLLGGTGRRAVRLLAVFVPVLTLASQLLAQGSQPPVSLDTTTLATIIPDHFSFDPAEEPDARSARDPNLDSALATLADAGATGAALASMAEAAGLKVDGDLVEVVAEVDAANVAAAQQAIQAVGGRVVYTSMDNTQIQALAPVGALRALAADPAIAYVRRPDYLTTFGELQAGARTTVGVTHTNAAAWHNAGFRGAGVRIAVIDGGFQGYTTLLGTDLPASVVAQNFASTGDIGGGTPHGTACAEIIYDMAPQSSLYLLRIATALDLQRAVTYAIQNGIQVISSSIGFYNLGPGDGTGFLASEVARARSAGIVWVTAAGNQRLEHWGGTFADADSDGAHEFASGVEINCIAPQPGGECAAIPSGYALRAFLRWDNWAPPVNQDYDLAIVRWNGSAWQRVSTGGDSFQNGGANQRPTEFAVAQTSGAATAYGVVIQRYRATRADVNFNLFVANVPALRLNVPARSLSDLADSPGAITVAALDARNPFPQEPYSSEGPTNGPGGTLNGGLLKPDLAAFANVDTRAYGTTPGQQFNGTSSATPHVAGAAALVRGALSGYTPAQVAYFLTSRAIDMGPPGRDTRFGHGRLWLGDPSNTAPPPSLEVYLPRLQR
ncbi:MAG: S8 family serine peptidase [Oscillochloridaceae bacterium]|nr:S8 family serine peptidase [Chloroflexaceae bacterium]MDW8390407.1 S8 family serine peptidase [Oscillochloridaceae bacterium]